MTSETLSQTTLTATCEWFALCDHQAAGTVSHPVLGQVPTCERCAGNLDLDLERGTLVVLSARQVEDTWTGHSQWFVTTDEGIELGTYVAAYPLHALAEAWDDLV